MLNAYNIMFGQAGDKVLKDEKIFPRHYLKSRPQWRHV
jgi:hypothetical protein